MNPIIPSSLSQAPALRNGKAVAQAAASGAVPDSAAARPSLSVVIPVYNSAEILPALLPRLQAALAALTARYEIILVNDGSRDHSWEVAATWAQQYREIVAIDLMRNYGQHNALLCGIRAAQYEVIITMDDDLQHPPEEIPKLLAKLAEGYDVVYGTPQQEQHGLWRDLASVAVKMVLQGTMGAEIARKVSAFRAFHATVRDAFTQYHGNFVSIDVLLTWATMRFAAVGVSHQPRYLGKSNYDFLKLVRHAFNMMTGFSTMPLQLASWIGFGFTLFGFGVLIYVLGRYLLMGTSVQGFPFLASIIAIFSGAQLFALGIFGEYLARMYSMTMRRPSYAVRDTINA
ncbi:glycosyltransferase family 2 protein [candidate division KSB1 bacterium]|nr:glycosyltransferase family 2 protein [candidate division KSB1 bacterium]